MRSLPAQVYFAFGGSSARGELRSTFCSLFLYREFTMAEIEHFVHPDKKQHAKFAQVADMHLPLFSAARQAANMKESDTSMSLREAVRSGTINNETLAYFMGRIYLYLVSVGVDPAYIRFRQHQSNEMAHYASDCWDAEIRNSYVCPLLVFSGPNRSRQ